MPSATGQNWEKYQKKFADDEPEEKKITPLSDEDIQVLKTYGAAPYAAALKKLEKEIKDRQTSVNEKIGVKVQSDHTTHMQQQPYSCPHRSQTLVSPLRISGISPPIDNACKKSNRSKSPAAQRSSPMKGIQRRANMSSTSNK